MPATTKPRNSIATRHRASSGFRSMPKTLFVNAAELVTNKGAARKGGVGVTQEDLGIIPDGALLWDSKKGIVWMGPTKSAPKAAGAKRVSLKGKVLSPALTDCHTHLVFAGSRHHELALRLEGATYQEIAASGGGIASSVKATRQASENELYQLAKKRLAQAMALGVGIIEI